jgi:patatin-like phospholipase/acyl hydrolase
VDHALRKPSAARRGVRILAMDGGGMRGLATIEMVRALERTVGMRVSDSFDLICGTSSGGILATGLGIMEFTTDECEALYRNLGVQVFGQVLRPPPAPATCARVLFPANQDTRRKNKNSTQAALMRVGRPVGLSS